MPGPVGVTEPEKVDLRPAHAALGQIQPGFGAAGVVQAAAEGLLGQLMHAEDRRAQLGIGVGVFRSFGQRNSASLGELFQCLVKADALHLLDKFEDVAALPAAEALEELVVGVDPEGWGLFGMKGAESAVALSGPYSPETAVLTHYADD